MGISTASMAQLRRHTDHAGAMASGICLVHCLMTPVVISLFPGALPYLPGDLRVHRLLAAIILLIGAAAFIPGYRIHRRKALLGLIAIGLLLILCVAWAGNAMSPSVELVLSVSGSLILVAAHLLNRSFCLRCTACEETDVCQTTRMH
ncbi:MerC domain-containing protein [Edaphobacter flagellatus]|uniref:MerC domain-containing protein n=1 Tax=Edaphobacter flagellatus TaxID=1933044 RepID=UPI0021B38176|nr:MerC domain-containing protein [Edaphobacter flagellatus]